MTLIKGEFIPGLLSALVLLVGLQASYAGSATWNLNPGSGDWNTAANWTPATVPNGPADTATFATSNQTNLSSTDLTEVNGIIFNVGGSAFTITASPTFTLTISGVGITNNSGITQNFVASVDGAGNFGTIAFTNSATAGSLTALTNNGSIFFLHDGGSTEFFDTSTAGNGTFTNNGGTASFAFGGSTQFLASSSADNGAFTNNGGVVTNGYGGTTVFGNTSTAGSGTFTNNAALTALAQSGGETVFHETSTAGDGTFTNIGSAVSGGFGGTTYFEDSSTAGNATLIATGSGDGTAGAIQFFTDSTGGTARAEVFGTGNLDISNHFSPGMAIGSIEGSGAVFLGSFKLTIGSNNLSTTFSGTIQDGGKYGGTGGSLAKIGKGKLILSGANTYTGGTTVDKGTLLVTNRTGSATGTGSVQVKAGTLGGTGKISGAVTVASGRTPAILSPGSGARPGTLTTLSTLAFNARATYKIDLNSTTLAADKVAALGVTITSGALVSIDDLGSNALTAGTVFTVISNTAATPITGTFSNLADGSTLVVGSNTYKANYEGGDGNDLTLTVQ